MFDKAKSCNQQRRATLATISQIGIWKCEKLAIEINGLERRVDVTITVLHQGQA